MDEARRLDAIPYDVKDGELGHHGKECSFEAILKKYKLTNDPALVLLGKMPRNGSSMTRSMPIVSKWFAKESRMGTS